MLLTAPHTTRAHTIARLHQLAVAVCQAPTRPCGCATARQRHHAAAAEHASPATQTASCSGKAAVLTALYVARSIQALLSAPNPDDPLSENVAKHWKENEKEAVATGVHLPCQLPAL